MATSRNLIMNGVTGTLKKQVVFRRVGDKTIISAYPDMSRRKLSPKQKQLNELMLLANAEVKAIIKDEQQRNAAQLRLNVPRNKLYTSLIREYFQKALQKDATP